MGKFKPHTPAPNQVKGLYVTLEPKMHKRIRDAAHASGISMKALVIQALEYALDNMHEAAGSDD